MAAELLSIELLNNVMHGKDFTLQLKELAEYSSQQLKQDLNDDDRKKAFWINLFNAAVIINLRSDKSVIRNLQGRMRFFGKRNIIVAGKTLSLNTIWHGILRKSRLRTGRGYLKSPFPGNFEKTYRLEQPDARIHFALNYGSVSCPPVRVYEGATINNQLESSTISFIDNTVFYYPDEHLVTVSQIFNWYSADFGGNKGIIRLLDAYNKIPFGRKPLVIFTPFKWKPLPTF